MTSLSVEYRNRLYATQQSRRSRKEEDRRRSGPVDVDDFYVPARQPSSPAGRRSKTPQPSNVHSRILPPQWRNDEERRSQSAPRSISEQQATPPSNNRQLANNGETVFCFQPGRRRFKAPRRPSGTVDDSDGKEKKSMSQFQLINERRRQNIPDTQQLLQHHSVNRQQHQSAVPQISTRNALPVNEDTRIDLRIPSKPDVTGTVPAKTLTTNQSPSDDPRLYAANYYAKKVGVHGKSHIRDQATVDESKSKSAHKSITRSMSQKMADCLLLSKTMFDDESLDSKRRKSKSSNPLTSMCFFDNLADVSHDTIDITTIDVNSYDGRSPNISALYDHSPYHHGTASSKKSMPNTNRTTSVKKWNEDGSTNQTTTVTTSSSDNDEEYDDTITSESIPRPPKVLNMMKITTSDTRQHKPSSTPLIQLNPDDYDYSYRKKRNISVPLHEDMDFMSELAVTSALAEAPSTRSGPLQPQRDLQRRPRGMFELVTSNDNGDDDNNDDETTTAFSTPYDESGAKDVQDSRCNDPDMSNDINQLKYKQALLESQQHRKLLATVENQLKTTVLELQVVKNELQQTKSDAAERSRAYADATARIVQERLDSDEKLQQEREVNKTLNDEVESLKREVISLSLELERAVHRNNWSNFQIPDPSSHVKNNSLADDLSTTSNRSDPRPLKAAEKMDSQATSNAQMDEATKALEFMSEKLQASQKEIADLQSQITALRVASELYSQSYDQMQRERDDAIAQNVHFQREIDQAKTSAREMNIQTNLFEREVKETARLKEEIIALTNDLNFSNIRASDYATNVLRLEEELIRAQLDAAKYEIQAASLEKELRQSKRAATVATPLQQSEDQSLRMREITSKSRSEESIHASTEQAIERQLVENELVQRFTSNSFQSYSVSQQGNVEDINSTERGPMGKVCQDGGSSDLLDILRRKLGPT